MRFFLISAIVLAAFCLSFAQLLPKNTAEDTNSIKLTRAMVFKVHYGEIPSEPDSTYSESEQDINRPRRESHFIRNFLIGTGACITEATIGAALNSSGPVVCPLTEGLMKF